MMNDKLDELYARTAAGAQEKREAAEEPLRLARETVELLREIRNDVKALREQFGD